MMDIENKVRVKGARAQSCYYNWCANQGDEWLYDDLIYITAELLYWLDMEKMVNEYKPPVGDWPGTTSLSDLLEKSRRPSNPHTVI